MKGHTDANSIWTRTAGRLYAHQAPVKAVRPYVVFVPYPGPILRVFGGKDIEEPRIQIDVVNAYDNDSGPTWIIYNALIAELEYADLALLSAVHVVTRRESQTPRIDVAENILTISDDWMTSYQTQVPKP